MKQEKEETVGKKKADKSKKIRKETFNLFFYQGRNKIRKEKT